MNTLKPPETLNFEIADLSHEWRKWKDETGLYLDLATKKDDKDTKVKLFLYLIGSKGREIHETMKFETPEKDRTIEELLKSFDEYCDPKRNETVERHKFFMRNQEEGESFDKYLTELKILEKTCDFGTLSDSLIRDRIVCGINRSSLRERLLREPNLNLKSCIDLCRASELSKERNKSLTNTDTVSRINSRTSGDRSQRFNRNTQQKPMKTCLYCGRQHEMIKEKCPAYGKTCNHCKGRNHFAACCGKIPNRNMPPIQTRQVKSVNDHNDADDDDSEYDEVNSLTALPDAVYSVGEQHKRKLFASMTINNANVKFQLDSGATCNVITSKILQATKCTAEITTTNTILSMYNGTTVKPTGHCKVKMINPKNKRKYLVNFVVVDHCTTPILGSMAIQQMELIKVLQENISSVQTIPQSIEEGKRGPVTKASLLELYPEVFQGIGCMPGEYHLTVDSCVQPVVHPPRKVPLALKDNLQAELRRLTKLQIIEPVSKPTKWVSSMVTTKKPNGDIRICIDPKDLNEALQRSHYPIPTMDDVLPQLNNAKIFTTVDMKCGFWQVKLDDASADLTTFNTPSGRFRWLRMPFGISTAPEEFQRRQHEAVEGLPGVISVYDDILIFGEGDTTDEAMVDHDKKMNALMERCKERNITLNKDKIQLKMPEVRFLGHLLTANGVQADPDKVRAITEMPNPTDVKGVQRLLGVVNYLSKFLPQLSEVCEPLRTLTLKETLWCWLDVHDQAFKRIKELVTEAPVLRYYDPSEELTLQCDASDKGLGAALLQQGQPIAYASRALTQCEHGYVPIEKELLAVVYGMERFHHYTYGRKVIVHSDHKPLESITRKPLHKAPKRLQRMLLRLQDYEISLQYQKGTEQHLADTLSRAYLTDEPPTALMEELSSINANEYTYVSKNCLEDIVQKTKTDPVLQELDNVIHSGWPEKKDEVTLPLRPYFHCRDELSSQEGLIYRGERVVIPTALRKEMMKRIHSSHIGVEGCLRRARVSLYWPGMDAQLKDYIQSCETCLATGAKQQKETMIAHDVKDRPWSKVGLDLFEFNKKNYLVTVDYFSNFVEVDRLEHTKSSDVIHKVKAHFARHGIPDTVVSDNGPQFSSEEFKSFSKKWGFTHVTSSPRYPQSNGLAENAVKTVKRLMTRAKVVQGDVYLSLLDFRNTPTQGMSTSPMERLMSRRARTLLPIDETLLQPKLNQETGKERIQMKEKQKKYYNRNAKDLPPLLTGDVVRIEPEAKGQQWGKAKVISQNEYRPRSYKVETEAGQILDRNRRHLKATPPSPWLADEQDGPSPEEESSTSAAAPERQETQHQTRSGRTVKMPSYLQDYVTG